ncbi:hypothetical protein DVH24_000965 [Malus domestica]|uniref:Uncharacterized protein n=1 Tax=Malus domestica TaxID=3750 RepID=A0A498JZG1_MALDO|nr:hypothetical protein DVH24_000965 [Malus domestica]
MTTLHDLVQPLREDVLDEGILLLIKRLATIMMDPMPRISATSSREKSLYGEFCTHKPISFNGSTDLWAAELRSIVHVHQSLMKSAMHERVESRGRGPANLENTRDSRIMVLKDHYMEDIRVILVESSMLLLEKAFSILLW